jgi:ABC-2 type transport system permease protein
LNWFFELNYSLDRELSIFAVIWILAIISIALGIFFSNFARNEGQVFPFIPLVIFPSVFLSGLLITVERLPEWAQVISRIVPLYYANQLLQKIILPKGSLSDDWASLVGLLAYGIIVLGLANLTLREQD